MLLGRAEEAKAAYLANKGQQVSVAETWERLIAESFAGLRRMGLTHPMMSEIETMLGTGER
jgi:hypothetical protein